jgi:hypothetical protein
VILDIKCYILNLVPSKLALLEPIVASVAMDHQMAVIQAQIGKNLLKMCLDGGFGVNIIMKKLKVQLGLSKPKPVPCNLHMVDQTIATPLGLIKDLKILIHEIPYTLTFTMIQSSVLNSNYSMLLGRP